MRRAFHSGRMQVIARPFLLLCLALSTASLVTAQDISGQIQDHLASGEFATAIDLANQLDGDQSDQWLSEISQAQLNGGAVDGAYYSAGSINNDVTRANTLGNLLNNSTPNPNQGGITEADFNNLIDLIKGTIAPDDWDDTNGDGSIQAYPAGVYVDASGSLLKIKPGNETLNRLREVADSRNSKWNSISDSGLRKISLVKLEREAQLLAARGKSLPDEMTNLAGMYEIRYLMADPDSGDLIIAGPAGPWKRNDEGRAINVASGKPVLQLDDLVVCLRNAYEQNGKFGCAITPRQQNLADTMEFVESTQLTGNAYRKKLRKKLGDQDIEVFGIDPKTHAGRILVEADYRMKLIGVGLEDSIPEIPSFLSQVELNADGSAPPMDVVRLWFTLNYDDVFADKDRLAFEFHGTGVKVLTENEMINEQGKRIHTGQATGPNKQFADDFTDHYAEISEKYPIYQQLKNVFDMALISALIRQERLAEQANWNMTFFRSDSELRYQPQLEATPTQVASVMNHRVINRRGNGVTYRHELIGVSGGVTYDVSEVVSQDQMKTEASGELASTRKASTAVEDSNDWFWD